MPKSFLLTLQERPLSSDHFKTFSKCAKKYHLQYLQRLNWPSDQRNFELGKSVHKLMEYQARRLPLEALLLAAPGDVQAVWHKLSAHPVSQWEIVASEWAFSVPVYLSFSWQDKEESHHTHSHQYWLSGRVDRIAWQAETQTLWILDWKTGTAAPKMPESDWQTRIYLWAVIKAYKNLREGLLDETLKQKLPEEIQPNKVKFKYLEVSVKDPRARVQEYNVSFNKKRFEDYQLLIQQHLQSLVSHACQSDFPLPQACPDMYCPYHPVCGIKQELERLASEAEEVTGDIQDDYIIAI